MTIEGLKIVHALPGRVRLRIDKIKDNPGLVRRAENQLARVPGIKQVETATTTGSLLIHSSLEELCAEASLATLEETLRELFPEIGVRFDRRALLPGPRPFFVSCPGLSHRLPMLSR